MPTPSLAELTRQFHSEERQWLIPLLIDGAKAHGLEPAFVLAVASRETEIHNVRGDGGHGHGPMQLDDRYHQIPSNWETHPQAIIAECCDLLRTLVAWARREWPQYNALKIAASAYNAGSTAAARGVAAGDCDRYTTGRDYGRDVLARMAVFEKLLAEKP